jgi:hypothetical protein
LLLPKAGELICCLYFLDAPRNQISRTRKYWSVGQTSKGLDSISWTLSGEADEMQAKRRGKKTGLERTLTQQ